MLKDLLRATGLRIAPQILYDDDPPTMAQHADRASRSSGIV